MPALAVLTEATQRAGACCCPGTAPTGTSPCFHHANGALALRMGAGLLDACAVALALLATAAVREPCWADGTEEREEALRFEREDEDDTSTDRLGRGRLRFFTAVGFILQLLGTVLSPANSSRCPRDLNKQPKLSRTSMQSSCVKSVVSIFSVCCVRSYARAKPLASKWLCSGTWPFARSRAGGASDDQRCCVIYCLPLYHSLLKCIVWSI